MVTLLSPISLCLLPFHSSLPVQLNVILYREPINPESIKRLWNQVSAKSYSLYLPSQLFLFSPYSGFDLVFQLCCLTEHMISQLAWRSVFTKSIQELAFTFYQMYFYHFKSICSFNAILFHILFISLSIFNRFVKMKIDFCLLRVNLLLIMLSCWAGYTNHLSLIADGCCYIC